MELKGQSKILKSEACPLSAPKDWGKFLLLCGLCRLDSKEDGEGFRESPLTYAVYLSY